MPVMGWRKTAGRKERGVERERVRDREREAEREMEREREVWKMEAFVAGKEKGGGVGGGGGGYLSVCVG